jgi:mitochondrial GTPase 1
MRSSLDKLVSLVSHGTFSIKSLVSKKKSYPQKMKVQVPLNFRTDFRSSHKLVWYPKHQSRAQQQLQKGLHHIDLVIEIRDARIPLTSINRDFDSILGNRPRFVVYNKSDLANLQFFPLITQMLLKHRNEECIFTQATKSVGKIFEKAREIAIGDPIRYPYLSLIIVGPPNVGKSTILNQLRGLTGKQKVAKVGAYAGVTTTIQTRVKIHDDPPIYLYDTPGIFNPYFTTTEEGLKIALTGATNDHITTSFQVADYLLFTLNNSKYINEYPHFLNLKYPTDDMDRLALHIAKWKGFRTNQRDRIKKLVPEGMGEWDTDRACKWMVELFRCGSFGRITLDTCTEIEIETNLMCTPQTQIKT